MWCCYCGGCCYSCGCCTYCSECVCTAACNPELCSTCITGACCCGAPCTPDPGSGVAICSPCCCSWGYCTCKPCSPDTCGSTCQAPCACAMFAGTDSNCNEIYQLEDGSLVYGDGSPATQADIACNEGACKGTICNPSGIPGSGAAPRGGNSGSGSSPSSGGGSGLGGGGKPSGQPPKDKAKCQQNKLTAAMSKLGATLTGLLTGGKKVPARKVLPGQTVQASVMGMSPNSFLLVIIVVGGMLLWMAFGHKPVAD